MYITCENILEGLGLSDDRFSQFATSLEEIHTPNCHLQPYKIKYGFTCSSMKMQAAESELYLKKFTVEKKE